MYKINFWLTVSQSFLCGSYIQTENNRYTYFTYSYKKKNNVNGDDDEGRQLKNDKLSKT